MSFDLGTMKMPGKRSRQISAVERFAALWMSESHPAARASQPAMQVGHEVPSGFKMPSKCASPRKSELMQIMPGKMDNT